VTTYRNFDVRFSRAEESSYRASVDKQGVSNSFKLPFAIDEASGNVLSVGREILIEGKRRRGLTKEEAEKRGKELFEAVFKEDLVRSLERSLGDRGNVRLRFFLEETPELAQLPWEYLYDDHYGPLALHQGTPIVRFLGSRQPTEPLAVDPPLRILVVVANPKLPGYDALDVEGEMSRMEAALHELERNGLVWVDYVQKATLGGFMDEISRDKYHVLHFIGHGSQERGGSLLFEKGQYIDAETLRVHLRDRRSLRIAVLNTCHGAQASSGDPFTGVAQSLIGAGVPAVVAMQFAISDEAAKDFAKGFYRSLANDNPIDAALADARKSILGGWTERNQEGKIEPVEWGTPVLFLRSDEDSRLLSVRRLDEERKKALRTELIEDMKRALEEENWPQAKKRLETASRLDHDKSEVKLWGRRIDAHEAYEQAVARFGKGDKDGARALFHKVKKLAPDHKELSEYLSQLEDHTETPSVRVADGEDVASALASHYSEVVRATTRGDIVFFFGSDIPLYRPSAGPWRPGSQRLPGYRELAGYLASTFDYPANEPRHLAQIAQYLYVTKGSELPLYRELHNVYDAHYEPTPFHEFFVKNLPELLRDKGYDPKPPITISINFDDVLIQTYKRFNIPFDLLKYAYPRSSRGEPLKTGGRYVHVPYELDEADEPKLKEGTPVPILTPNEYEAPLDTRPVIIKIFGVVERGMPQGRIDSEETFVITEDHHVDSMVSKSIVEQLPTSIITRVQSTPFLFLSHNLKDWHVRGVFRQLSLVNAWLVHPGARSEREFWAKYKPNVEILDVPLKDYTEALIAYIENYPLAGSA